VRVSTGETPAMGSILSNECLFAEKVLGDLDWLLSYEKGCSKGEKKSRFEVGLIRAALYICFFKKIKIKNKKISPKKKKQKNHLTSFLLFLLPLQILRTKK
jgi:hypothetical protein